MNASKVDSIFATKKVDLHPKKTTKNLARYAVKIHHAGSLLIQPGLAVNLTLTKRMLSPSALRRKRTAVRNLITSLMEPTTQLMETSALKV